MPTLGPILITLSFLVAGAATYLVLRRARRLGLVQAPNDRSSHKVPTPSGGGIGIVAGGTLAAIPTALVAPWLALPVMLAALLMAWVGYTDDRRPIGASWRLGAQVVLMGATFAVLPLDLIAGVPDTISLIVLTLAGALWINLFNFMDGIDGLAGSEAVYILAAAAVLSTIAVPGVGNDPRFWWMLGLAAATFGFLLFNWPPARIFMGDVGSTFLGLMTAFFAIITVLSSWLSLWQWLILAALFLADSLTTLGRRALNREPIWEAHKRHAYQHLQRRFGSHRKVTLLYLAVNIVVLLPLAWLAGASPDGAPLIAAATFVVLFPLMLLAGAGAPLEQAQQVSPGANDRE
ncbi:MAG: MraY family glycosyltransferase [Devosia sp.]